MDSLEGYLINLYGIFNWNLAYEKEKERFNILKKEFKKNIFHGKFPLRDIVKRILITLLIFKLFNPSVKITKENVQSIFDENPKMSRFILWSYKDKIFLSNYEKELSEKYINLIDELSQNDIEKYNDLEYYFLKYLTGVFDVKKRENNYKNTSLSDKVIGGYEPLIKSTFRLEDL